LQNGSTPTANPSGSNPQTCGTAYTDATAPYPGTVAVPSGFTVTYPSQTAGTADPFLNFANATGYAAVITYTGNTFVMNSSYNKSYTIANGANAAFYTESVHLDTMQYVANNNYQPYMPTTGTTASLLSYNNIGVANQVEYNVNGPQFWFWHATASATYGRASAFTMKNNYVHNNIAVEVLANLFVTSNEDNPTYQYNLGVGDPWALSFYNNGVASGSPPLNINWNYINPPKYASAIFKGAVALAGGTYCGGNNGTWDSNVANTNTSSAIIGSGAAQRGGSTLCVNQPNTAYATTYAGGTTAPINPTTSNVGAQIAYADTWACASQVVTGTPGSDCPGGTPSLTAGTSYQSAFASWPNYTTSNLTNRAAVIARVAPLAGGTMQGGTGTGGLHYYYGPLMPANNFGEVCWNTGAVFDTTAHCTQAQ
jgi:hypothetical protein